MGFTRAVDEARRFVVRHGKEFGLNWDEDRDCLAVGQRAETGESIGSKENHSNYFRSGLTVGQPLDFDRYESFELFEKITEGTVIYGSELPSSNREELIEIVGAALERLRPSVRRVLVMRYFDSLTLQEIGTALDVSYQAVQSRLRTAHRNFMVAFVGEVTEANAGLGSLTVAIAKDKKQSHTN